MPITIDPALVDHLVKRQVAAEQMQERFAPDAVESAPQGELSPSLLAALGAAADGASTYRFLKKGTGREDNAMFSSALHEKPALTGLIAAGTGLAGPLLGKALKGKLPKGIIEAIVANLAARTTAAAGMNIQGGADGFTGMNEMMNINRIQNREEQKLPSRLPRPAQ